MGNVKRPTVEPITITRKEALMILRRLSMLEGALRAEKFEMLLDCVDEPIELLVGRLK